MKMESHTVMSLKSPKITKYMMSEPIKPQNIYCHPIASIIYQHGGKPFEKQLNDLAIWANKC